MKLSESTGLSSEGLRFNLITVEERVANSDPLKGRIVYPWLNPYLGVVFRDSGKVPSQPWLLVALALGLVGDVFPWIGVIDSQSNEVVVVSSKDPEVEVGHRWSWEPNGRYIE